MTSLKDLYRQAQKGDSSAFNTWIDCVQPNTGRFAYQVGVSIEHLPAFQQRTIEPLYAQLEKLTSREAEIELYKLIIHEASLLDFSVESKRQHQVLGFLEDQELHDALQQLELAQRICLALFYFQELSLEEVLTITKKSESRFVELKNEGLQKLQSQLQLNELQITQRLAMLQKSYQRFTPPPPFRQQQPEKKSIGATDAMLLQSAQPRVQKKTAIVLGAAALFLAVVIGATFAVTNQQSSTAGTTVFQQEDIVTDEMVADWRSQYETIKRTSPARLGMTQEQYEQLEYVKRADSEMELVFSEETLESFKEDPIELQFKVERLFREVETPRGMVQSLSVGNSILSNEVEVFLQDYAAKTDELRVFADSILMKYRQELESTIVMDQLSPEKLLAQTESYPEELRMVVEALPESNLFVVAHPNENRFRTVRDVSFVNQQQPIMNDPYAWQYLNVLSIEPYFDSSGFLVPLDTVPQHLITMEQALLEEDEVTALFDGVEVAYLQTFWQLVKGSGNFPVFDEEGKVKIEYREAWNGVSSSNPIAYLMLPILEEMEASDWTSSEHYDDLKFDDLADALEMEKSGELADKLPNGNLVIEDELVDLKDFDYSRIESLYESFESSYDLQILAGVPPLDVLFMYHYANKLDDTETLWHLLANSPIKPTLEVFQEVWQPIPELTENANWIELSADSHKGRMKDKVYIYPQVGSDEFLERLDAVLVTEKDQIWQIDYQQYNTYDLLDENQQFVQTIDSLYASISDHSQNQLPAETGAGEVAGVFFKAAENEDVAVMKKLMAETDWTNEELQYFLDLSSFRPFSELEQLTFRTHFSPNMPTHLSGIVDIKYVTESPTSAIQEMYFMEKTAVGWRMENLKNF